MAVQGIWNGTIGFSLVAIPVRVVTAVVPGHVSFHLLHSKDYSRLERKMYCPADERMVTPEEIIRGYEVLPGKYIPLTDEELESVSPERSRTIEIIEFIDMKDVDPIYYDHPYYLVPSKGGEKAYQLLAEVMARTKKAGLAKFVLAEREHLVAITSKDGALALTTLHYSDEVLPDGEMSPAKGAAESGEVARMKKSIENMMKDFDPGKYADGRRKKIMDLLEAKVKEKALVDAPAMTEKEEEGPADLVAALEESMRKVKVKEGR
jgi:DNA end-binding protein Ku